MISLSSSALNDSDSSSQPLRTLSVDWFPTHKLTKNPSALTGIHAKWKWFSCFRNKGIKNPNPTQQNGENRESTIYHSSLSSPTDTVLSGVRSRDQPPSTPALQTSPISRKVSTSMRSTFNLTLSDAFRNFLKTIARYRGTRGRQAVENSSHSGEPGQQCYKKRLYLEVSQTVQPECSPGIIDTHPPTVVTQKPLPSLETELSSSAAVYSDHVQATKRKEEPEENYSLTTCCTPTSEQNEQIACSSGHSSLNAICSSLFGTTPTKSEARTMQFSSTNMAQLSQSLNVSPMTQSIDQSPNNESRCAEVVVEKQPRSSVRSDSEVREQQRGKDRHVVDKNANEKYIKRHSNEKQPKHGEVTRGEKKPHASVEPTRATTAPTKQLVVKSEGFAARETQTEWIPIRRAIPPQPKHLADSGKISHTLANGRRQQSKSPAQWRRAYSHTGCRGDTGRVAFQNDRQNHNGDPYANKGRATILKKVKNEAQTINYHEPLRRTQNNPYSPKFKPLRNGRKEARMDRAGFSRSRSGSKPLRSDVEEVSATSMGDSSIITNGIMALADTSDLMGDTSIQTLDRELNKLCFGEKGHFQNPIRNTSTHSRFGEVASRHATFPPFSLPFYLPNPMLQTAISTSNFPPMQPWPSMAYSMPGISSKELMPLYPSHVPSYPTPYVYAREYPPPSIPSEMQYPSTWYPRMCSEPVILVTNQSNFSRKRPHKSSVRSRSLHRTRSRIPRMRGL